MHFFSLMNLASVFKRKPNKNPRPSLNKSSSVRLLTADDFKSIKLIGRGGFGEVYLVERAGKLYAMKKVKKAFVSQLGFADKIMIERDLLVSNALTQKSQWIVDLFYAFQDKEHLYFVMEYCPGGDLFYLLDRYRVFDETTTRFYIAELVLAVEDIHNMNFIHRDIKFDNVLITKEGHIKLTDFGLSKRLVSSDDLSKSATDVKEYKKVQQQISQISIGTLEFMAPEIVAGKKYTESCDLWSIGVLMYEMLAGRNPFYFLDSAETMKRIQRWWQLKFPVNVSVDAKDLIKKLLCSENTRLNLASVKAHPFFNSMDWDKVKKREITPPFIPKLLNATDTCCFDDVQISKTVAPHVLPPHIKRSKSSRKDEFVHFNYFGL